MAPEESLAGTSLCSHVRGVHQESALQQAGLPAYHDLIATCGRLEVLEEASAVGFVEGEGLDGAVPQREVYKFQCVAASWS